MKKLSIVLCFALAAAVAQAQSLKKITIANTNASSGCSLYAFCDMNFTLDYSEDSSKVFMSDCSKDGVDYGVICIKLSEPFENLEEAEATTTNYLDHLKKSFNITKVIGYAKAGPLRNNENTTGLLDYWEDATQNHWKIKAWASKKNIVIVYGYSKNDLPETKLNVYLDGVQISD